MDEQPTKFPRRNACPLDRDYYSLPQNDACPYHHHHKYHLRPREQTRYLPRTIPAAARIAKEDIRRNAHSYSLNGHRHSNSSTASSRKRKLEEQLLCVKAEVGRKRLRDQGTSGGSVSLLIPIDALPVTCVVSSFWQRVLL